MSRDAVAALAAQLFMVDFTGHVPAPDVVRLIEDDGIGGVILFVKNIASPRQVAVLTNSLQEIAAAAGRPPLLISADQEGGTVVRLREGATHFPSAMAFGAARSEALAASALARMLLREPAGPVTDPWDIPDGWRPGEPAWARCVRGGRRDPPRTHERCPRAWALGPGRQR